MKMPGLRADLVRDPGDARMQQSKLAMTPPAAPFVLMAAWAADPALRFTEAALAEARLCLLDTLACMRAGAAEPLVRKAAEAMVAAAATGPIPTVLDGVRLSAPAAALVNGTAAHVLDFDDYEIPASTHPSAAIVPALLAIAALRPVTLGEIADAYAVGYEFIVRSGRALGGYRHYLAGWHATSTVGPIGAAAAAARLLRLDPPAFAAAVSLATSNAAGLKAQFGTDAKPLHAGFAARAGLESALLAQAGAGASEAVTEGVHGFLALYGAGGSYATARPGAGGEAPAALESDPVLRKPWPCCAYTHRGIEAALRLAGSPGFDAGRIGAGELRIPEPFFRVARFTTPRTAAEARFSVLYCVAAALQDGDLGPRSFDAAAIARPAVRELMDRIRIDAYAPGEGIVDMSPAAPDSVSLCFADGSRRTQTVAEVRGGAGNPLLADDLLAKFVRCGGDAAIAAVLLHGAPDAPLDVARALGTG